MEILLFILLYIYFFIFIILYYRWSLKWEKEYLEKIIEENKVLRGNKVGVKHEKENGFSIFINVDGVAIISIL